MSMMSTAKPTESKERKRYTMTRKRETWSEDEHRLFVEGVQIHNRDWKKVAAHVHTKTVVQVRSHAQKWFLQMQKQGNHEAVPLTNSEAKKRNLSRNGRGATEHSEDGAGIGAASGDAITSDTDRGASVVSCKQAKVEAAAVTSCGRKGGAASESMYSHRDVAGGVDTVNVGGWDGGPSDAKGDANRNAPLPSTGQVMKHDAGVNPGASRGSVDQQAAAADAAHESKRSDHSEGGITPDYPYVYRFLASFFEADRKGNESAHTLAAMRGVDRETAVLLMAKMLQNMEGRMQQAIQQHPEMHHDSWAPPDRGPASQALLSGDQSSHLMGPQPGPHLPQPFFPRQAAQYPESVVGAWNQRDPQGRVLMYPQPPVPPMPSYQHPPITREHSISIHQYPSRSRPVSPPDGSSQPQSQPFPQAQQQQSPDQRTTSQAPPEESFAQDSFMLMQLGSLDASGTKEEKGPM